MSAFFSAGASFTPSPVTATTCPFERSAFTILVEENDSGKRLDLLVSSRISVCSRSAAARLIRNGKIRVKGIVEKPGYRVRTGDVIYGQVPPPEPVSLSPEPIEIEILFEDEYLIIVNKRPGMVVHPASGRYTGTLVNGLLYHYPELEGIVSSMSGAPTLPRADGI